MADPIYGIHQSQPRDVFSFTKANAKKVGLNADVHMLSSYPGFAGPGTTQIVFSDTPRVRRKTVLMDGRIRTYNVVTMYVVAIAPRSFLESLQPLPVKWLASATLGLRPKRPTLIVPALPLLSAELKERCPRSRALPRFLCWPAFLPTSGDEGGIEDVPDNGVPVRPRWRRVVCDRPVPVRNYSGHQRQDRRSSWFHFQ